MTVQTADHQASDRFSAGAGAALPNCRRLFTFGQAADYACVPIQMIRLWIQHGKLKAYRLAGGLRIDEVELAHFLAGGTTSGT